MARIPGPELTREKLKALMQGRSEVARMEEYHHCVAHGREGSGLHPPHLPFHRSPFRANAEAATLFVFRDRLAYHTGTISRTNAKLQNQTGRRHMLAKIMPITALALALAASGAAAQGRWAEAKPIPQGANEVIGAAVGGKLYLYGGQTAKGPLGIFWVFDPKTGDWTKLQSNPVPVHHAAAAAVGDKFYVFGGFRQPDTGKNGWYPEDKAWAYDTRAQTWSALPPMPTPRGALAAAAGGDKVYVVGGAKIPSGMDLPNGLSPGGPVEMLGTLEVFDTSKNSWTRLNPMSLPRNHHGVAYLDGKLYVMGGRVGSSFSGGWSTNITTTEIYDIASGTWSTGMPMPTARSGVGVAALAGKVHVLGGEGWLDDFGGVFRSNEAYDPKTNSWLKEARMLTPRHGFAVAVIDGKLYAVSGVNDAGGAGPLSVVDVNQVYTP